MKPSTIFALVAVASIVMFTVLGVTRMQCAAHVEVSRMKLEQTRLLLFGEMEARRIGGVEMHVPHEHEGESEADRPSVWQDAKTAQN